MSEHEFEAYLTLLCRFLHLTADQREEIAGELRDHLEQSVKAFEQTGMSHDEAIHRALDEFGDAASLASSFTKLNKEKRRKKMIRWSAASIISTAACVMAALLFWPDNPVTNPNNIALADEPSLKIEKENSDKILNRKIKGLDLTQNTFGDFVDVIADLLSIQILITQDAYDVIPELRDRNMKSDISIKDVSLEMALDLALASIGNPPITYEEREGILVITYVVDRRYIKVYDCRSLPEISAEMSRLITNTINDVDWNSEDGDSATVTDSYGLVIVRAHLATHREVEDLVDQLKKLFKPRKTISRK